MYWRDCNLIGMYQVKDSLIRFIKFSLVGGIATLFGSLTLYAVTESGVYYLISSIISTIVSLIIWFIGQSLWTFKDRRTTLGSFHKAMWTKGACIAANFGLLALFVEVFKIWYMASALTATVIVFLVSYWVSHKWVWHER